MPFSGGKQGFFVLNNQKTKPNKNKTTKTTKTNKEGLGPSEVALRCYQSNFSFFWVAFQNFPFLHLGPKNLNPKNTIKIGVLGPFF